MGALSKLLFSVLLLAPAQHEGVLDSVQARYLEVMGAAPREGLPWAILRLDEIAVRSPSASFTPRILETIQAVALLHPGSVPDHMARFEKMKQQAATDPNLNKVVKRLEILRSYFLAAAEDPPRSIKVDFDNQSLEGSILTWRAKADSAFRRGDYLQAESLAFEIVEADPFSALNASAYALLGLCESCLGNAQKAAGYANVSPLPTLYGKTQDYLTTLFRFVRPGANPAGSPFEELAPAKITGAAPLKDPRSLQRQGERFILIDRDQVLVVSLEGKVVETKPGRRIEDLADAGSGKIYYLADDFVDLNTGSPTRVSHTVAGKPKLLSKLRSLALDADGAIYFLDQDAGLLVGKIASGSSLSVRPIAPNRGSLVRIDRRGYILVLSADQRSIAILSREGKMLTTLAPSVPSGKEPSIEFFALDSLNHVYILDSLSNSIQIFTFSQGSGGLEKTRIANLQLDPRPYHKNLRVLSVSATGDIVAAGKNEDYWIVYR